MLTSPARLYLLLITTVPLIALARLAAPGSMNSLIILVASVADGVLLATFLAIYLAVNRYYATGSLLQRLNDKLHIAVVGILLGLLLAAELLHQRTGEVLDLDIIRFAIGNLDQLHGAIGSVLSWSDLVNLLVLLILAIVLLPAFSSRLIFQLRMLVLIFPWAILSANAAIDRYTTDSIPLDIESSRYQGRYAEIMNDHENWLASHTPAWRRGVLTGMVAGNVLTPFEFQLLDRTIPSGTGYSMPTRISAPTVRFNILFVVLESIRHDVVGAYQPSVSSPPPSPTPFIDSLATGGWRVDRAYTTITHTSKALVGIYCGTFARFSPLISESEPGGLPFDCLPKLLAPFGYATAHFQTAPAEFENRTGLLNNLGFATHYTQSSYDSTRWQRFGYLAMDDRAMVQPALSWMRTQQASGNPFFASVLTVLTHHPYTSPASNRAADDPAIARLNYLAALTYSDKVLSELFAEMDKSGLLNNTLVVITGDHGEAFSEHGVIAHNAAAFEEGMRVPMILWGKMLAQPKRIDGLRQHLDLVPTVLDLLGSKHDARFPGLSLAQNAGHQQIISSCFYEAYCLNLYDEKSTKTMYFFGKRPPAHYDLNKDPLELSNLLSDMPAETIRDKLTKALSARQQFERLFDISRDHQPSK